MDRALINNFSYDLWRREWSSASLFYLAMISLCLFGLDYITGPVIQEPYIYVLVIISAAWLIGPKFGYILATILPLFRVIIYPFWTLPWPLSETFVNVLIQIATLVIVAYLMARIRELIVEVRSLKGKLPICVHCKKIRNQYDEWEEMETYVARQSEMKFVHGVCLDCKKKHLEELSNEPRMQMYNA